MADAFSDVDILNAYMLARDAIVLAIGAGQDVVEYQVMSQRKRTADPVAELKLIEQQILYYERKVEAITQGRVRNYVRLVRAYGHAVERDGE